jgi:3-isopropylmalate/(R)-2-methylmalate dehydratase small subunit
MKLLPIVPASDGPSSPVPRFVRHSGTAVVLWRAGAGPEQTPHASLGPRPSIVIASEEVGVLSEGEARVSLLDLGIRVVIAPGFDAGFFSEAVRQGILLVALCGETIDAIAARLDANPQETITVDLESQTIEVPGLGRLSFDPPPRVRRKLLHGLDDLDELLEHRDVAAAFRLADRNRRPWLYPSEE